LVILLPVRLRAQSDRTDLAPGFASGLEPNSAATSALAPDAVQPLSPQLPGIGPLRPWPIQPVAPSRTFGLPQLAHSADMIFSAKITAVAHRPTTSGPALETVAITFHVENAIRGALPGEDLTVRQWIGLWSSGQRYRVGERVLLFLYPKSKLGLTSCVGWPLGRFAVDSRGRVLLTAQQLSALRQAPVVGGKSRVSFSDFALAVRQAGEEWTSTTTRR
jgi:hypothetical protein